MRRIKHSQLRCPYCGAKAIIIAGTLLYPGSGKKQNWYHVCRYCDAHVGCHPGTLAPLGSMADKETRYYRHQAHLAFDVFWLKAQNRKLARTEAYRWLAKKLGIPIDKCHIGMMDVPTAKKAIELSINRYLSQFKTE